MKKYKLVWIGIRESEISNTGNLFFASITMFGSNINNNFSFDKTFSCRFDYGKENIRWQQFVSETAKKLINQYGDIKFMGYYPAEIIEYDEIFSQHAICINDKSILNILDNKLYTKLWASSFVPTIPFSTFIDNELSYDQFLGAFSGYKKFVLQGTFSCGGSGTWLISCQEDLELFSFDDDDHIAMVTPYIENSISLNTHLVIYSKDIQYFPPSIQIIRKFDNKLCYEGGDFVSAQNLSPKLLDKIYDYSIKIGDRLSKNGYRGICGIDFLATGSDVYFVEINARFQSSSVIINRQLEKKHLPTLQEMNMLAFFDDNYSKLPINFDISESFISINYTPDTFMQTKYIWEIANLCPEVNTVVDDNIDWKYDMEYDTYLYKLIFNTNITCIAPDETLRIYSGLDYTWKLDFLIPWVAQAKEFKVALLNQGVRISKECLSSLENDGGPNYEMFYALDLTIDDTISINVPYKVAFSELSPFAIELQKGQYVLKYYDHVFAKVKIRTVDKYADKITSSGKPYQYICYMGVDRLRIHARSGCYFKECGLGCQFCGIEAGEDNSLNDIAEVLNTYRNEPCLRHFLLGGGSYSPSDNYEKIIAIAELIKETFDKDIYLMSIPPINCDILIRLKEAGITQVGFNLEIYDRNRARIIMPGKGSLALERYDNAFRKAVEIWGNDGNVRSALIVGLESAESTIRGIEHLCKLGVSPILSLFKPDGEMEEYMSPNNEEILYIWETAEEICNQYNVPLGPSCNYCEDNVLKITIYE